MRLVQCRRASQTVRMAGSTLCSTMRHTTRAHFETQNSSRRAELKAVGVTLLRHVYAAPRVVLTEADLVSVLDNASRMHIALPEFYSFCDRGLSKVLTLLTPADLQRTYTAFATVSHTPSNLPAFLAHCKNFSYTTPEVLTRIHDAAITLQDTEMKQYIEATAVSSLRNEDSRFVDSDEASKVRCYATILEAIPRYSLGEEEREVVAGWAAEVVGRSRGSYEEALSASETASLLSACGKQRLQVSGLYEAIENVSPGVTAADAAKVVHFLADYRHTAQPLLIQMLSKVFTTGLDQHIVRALQGLHSMQLNETATQHLIAGLEQTLPPYSPLLGFDGALGRVAFQPNKLIERFLHTYSESGEEMELRRLLAVFKVLSKMSAFQLDGSNLKKMATVVEGLLRKKGVAESVAVIRSLAPFLSSKRSGQGSDAIMRRLVHNVNSGIQQEFLHVTPDQAVTILFTMSQLAQTQGGHRGPESIPFLDVLTSVKDVQIAARVVGALGTLGAHSALCSYVGEPFLGFFDVAGSDSALAYVANPLHFSVLTRLLFTEMRARAAGDVHLLSLTSTQKLISLVAGIFGKIEAKLNLSSLGKALYVSEHSTLYFVRRATPKSVVYFKKASFARFWPTIEQNKYRDYVLNLQGVAGRLPVAQYVATARRCLAGTDVGLHCQLLHVGAVLLGGQLRRGEADELKAVLSLLVSPLQRAQPHKLLPLNVLHSTLGFLEITPAVCGRAVAESTIARTVQRTIVTYSHNAKLMKSARDGALLGKFAAFVQRQRFGWGGVGALFVTEMADFAVRLAHAGLHPEALWVGEAVLLCSQPTTTSDTTPSIRTMVMLLLHGCADTQDKTTQDTAGVSCGRSKPHTFFLTLHRLGYPHCAAEVVLTALCEGRSARLLIPVVRALVRGVDTVGLETVSRLGGGWLGSLQSPALLKGGMKGVELCKETVGFVVDVAAWSQEGVVLEFLTATAEVLLCIALQMKGDVGSLLAVLPSKLSGNPYSAVHRALYTSVQSQAIRSLVARRVEDIVDKVEHTAHLLPLYRDVGGCDELTLHLLQ